MNRIKHPRVVLKHVAHAVALMAAAWLGAAPVARAEMITIDVNSPDGVNATSPLSGPAGNSSHWNNVVMIENMASVAAGNLVNDAGTATTVGISLSFPGRDPWGSPALQMLESGVYNPAYAEWGQTELSGLTPGGSYDLYIAGSRVNEDSGANGTFHINGQSQILNNGEAPRNGSTWVEHVNYVKFQSLIADVSGKIAFQASDGQLFISGIQLVTASPVTVPPAPTGLVATPGNAQVALSWAASGGATGYRVKRSLTGGSGYATIATVSGTSYTNTGVVNGTTYYYVVTATNSAGESANSTVVVATPIMQPIVTLGVTGGLLAEAAGVATVQAMLSTMHTLAVTVNLAFAGTATPTTDYTRSATSIVIPAGSTSGTVTLTAVPDALYERPDETIEVAISTAVNATLSAPQQVTVTIVNDDPLPPIPVAAGQRGTVTCLDNPAISYDIYLPANYSATGAPLPILYTFNPGGGGMVGDFRSVCSNLQIIVVGITGSRNLIPWDVILGEVYAVTRDIRQRVVFDPTAEMASGMSGGGWASYSFSRYRPQHVAGVFPMGGWLGHKDFVYPITDRVQYNLLVARSAGTSDSGANYYLSGDKNFLTSCGAVVNDWSFTGGHEVAPDNIKTAALSWILTHRTLAGPNDRSTAQAQAAEWRARLGAGERQAVLYEAVYALMNQPRSWFAYQAQLILDQLMSQPDFCTLEVGDVARGDFANNHFYYTARGAALNGDLQTYRSGMKALTGILGVYGDRSVGIYTMLQQYGFATPVLGIAHDSGQLTVGFTKDSPGLTYALEACASPGSSTWQEVFEPVVETNTVWSAGFEVPPGARSGFYRIRATPTPATGDEWP